MTNQSISEQWMGDALIDAVNLEVRSSAGVTSLTGSEMVLLRALMAKPNEVLAWERLITIFSAGRREIISREHIHVVLTYLRRKLKKHNIEIKTRHTVGLILVDKNAPQCCPLCKSPISMGSKC